MKKVFIFLAGFLTACGLFYYLLYNAKVQTAKSIDGGIISSVNVGGLVFNYLSY